MGLLDDYTNEHGSPRPTWQHQEAISCALYTMGNELDEQGLNILPEATVTDDCNDLAPDLVVFDKQFNPRLVIDISIHKEVEAIMRKCAELITRFPKAEYFVYDYESEILHKYDALHDLWLSSTENDLYSAYLKLPVLHYFQEQTADLIAAHSDSLSR